MVQTKGWSWWRSICQTLRTCPLQRENQSNNQLINQSSRLVLFVKRNLDIDLVLLYFSLWLDKKLVPPTQPIRCKTNCDLVTRIFPRLVQVTCICLRVFSLVHCVVYVCYDWPLWLLWFWFYDTQLKTALTNQSSIDQSIFYIPHKKLYISDPPMTFFQLTWCVESDVGPMWSFFSAYPWRTATPVYTKHVKRSQLAVYHF